MTRDKAGLIRNFSIIAAATENYDDQTSMYRVIPFSLHGGTDDVVTTAPAAYLSRYRKYLVSGEPGNSSADCIPCRN